MSRTFALVCHETKLCVWIGQGNGPMTNFYTGDQNVMERLRRFLNEHKGKPLEFICHDDGDDWSEYAEFEDPDPEPEDPPDRLTLFTDDFRHGAATIWIDNPTEDLVIFSSAEVVKDVPVGKGVFRMSGLFPGYFVDASVFPPPEEGDIFSVTVQPKKE